MPIFNTTTRRVMCEQEDKPIYTPEGACGGAYAFWGFVLFVLGCLLAAGIIVANE